jgi:hypothetical protein
MPKPSHVKAFEFISEGTQDEIRDYIAFGLFMESEDEWASGKEDHLTDDEYKKYHDHILTPLQRERFRAGAVQVLDNFAARAIQAERVDLLKHHRKFRCAGIVEAILGAFLWTLLLIVLTVLAARAGIDILEYYKRAAGLQ